MNAKAIFLGAVIVSAGVLATMAWRAAADVRELEAEQTKTRDGLALVQAKLRQADQRLAIAERERAASNLAFDAIKKQPVETSSTQSKPATPRPHLMSILEMIRNEPDAEALYLAKSRSDLVARYGPLFRLLGLSAERVASFQDIAIKREEAEMDLADVLRTRGTEDSGAAVAKLKAAAEAEYETTQRELLGEEGYRQLKEYERTSWMRDMISAVAGAAVVEHAPFTAQQADELVRAMADSSTAYRSGGAAMINTVDWASVDALARRILSAEQFAVFSTMDPGPTHGGLLQNRMYSLVARADEADRTQAPSVNSIPPGK